MLTAHFVKDKSGPSAAQPGTRSKPGEPAATKTSSTNPAPGPAKQGERAHAKTGAGSGPTDPGQGNSKISRVDAQGHVVVVTATDVGRGDYGVYNAETGISYTARQRNDHTGAGRHQRPICGRGPEHQCQPHYDRSPPNRGSTAARRGPVLSTGYDGRLRLAPEASGETGCRRGAQIMKAIGASFGLSSRGAVGAKPRLIAENRLLSERGAARRPVADNRALCGHGLGKSFKRRPVLRAVRRFGAARRGGRTAGPKRRRQDHLLLHHHRTDRRRYRHRRHSTARTSPICRCIAGRVSASAICRRRPRFSAA